MRSLKQLAGPVTPTDQRDDKSRNAAVGESTFFSRVFGPVERVGPKSMGFFTFLTNIYGIL